MDSGINLNTSVPIIDLRSENEFQQKHIRSSTTITAQELEDRTYELPPKGSELRIVGNGEQLDFGRKFFLKHGYKVLQEIQVSGDFWNQLSEDLFEVGDTSKTVWKPSPFLESCIDKIEAILKMPQNNNTEGTPIKLTALDLACGSGRDVVYLSCRGWSVTGIDYLPSLLEKAQLLATRNKCTVQTVCLDMEKSIVLESQFPQVDLVHVARYLHRPLFPSIINLIKPGGFIVYHTFMKGCEAFGKPKNPRFILEPEELKKVFKDFLVIDYQEATIEDGRPVQMIVAQKPL